MQRFLVWLIAGSFMTESGQAPHEIPATQPALHFTADAGWINDPVGLTYHDGRYHLFFQYIRGQAVWSPRCCWGHAVSYDLLTWTEQAPILEPGDGDGGCWSGSLVVDDNGQATIFYTSVQLDNLNIGRIRTAQPDDETWNTWRKGALVEGIAPTNDAGIFRDPQVSRDGDGWRMLVGSGRNDGAATALAYTSPDLIAWTFGGEFTSRSSTEQDQVWTGKVWECPQLVHLGSKHVLLFSVWEQSMPYYEAYAIGSLINGEFKIEKWGRLSYGDSYYAGATFADAAGRPGMIYWLREVTDSRGRWTGAHSLPHLLRLDGNNQLTAEPHPNVAQRRGPVVKITPDLRRAVKLPPVADLEWNLEPRRPATLRVCSADGTQVVRMIANDGALKIEITDKTWTMPYSASLRLVFDGPVIELFSVAGLFAAPIPVAGTRTISLTNSSCLIYELREHMNKALIVHARQNGCAP